MKTHILVENGPTGIQSIISEITAFFHDVGDVEMERVLLFDLDFDLMETIKTYQDSEGTIIKIIHKHHERSKGEE